MADVTDTAFRSMIAKYSHPDALWTEFVSADGLYHTREIQHIPDDLNPLMKDLSYDPGTRPVVAQLFTSDPAMMEYGAALVDKLGFDGLDINMGCPDRSVERQHAGAALIKNPSRARELVRAAKRGVSGNIPVSVKTRVGYNTVSLEDWLEALLLEEPDAITVHARTRKEMSKVPAKWEHVSESVTIRNRVGKKTLILGNGDVVSMSDAYEKAHMTGADGIMVGRGIFGNPWFFSEHFPTRDEKLKVLVEHSELFEKHCSHKSFSVMKKHFKAYVHGFDGAKEVRVALMNCSNATEVRDVITSYLQTP